MDMFCWYRHLDRAWMEERGAAEPVGERRARESLHAYAYATAADDPKLTRVTAGRNGCSLP